MLDNMKKRLKKFTLVCISITTWSIIWFTIAKIFTVFDIFNAEADKIRYYLLMTFFIQIIAGGIITIIIMLIILIKNWLYTGYWE